MGGRGGGEGTGPPRNFLFFFPLAIPGSDIHTCTHIPQYTYTHVHTFPNTHTHMYTHSPIHIHTCAHIPQYTYTHVHTFPNTHKHIAQYTYTHVHTHTLPNTQTQNPEPKHATFINNMSRGPLVSPETTRMMHHKTPPPRFLVIFLSSFPP